MRNLKTERAGKRVNGKKKQGEHRKEGFGEYMWWIQVWGGKFQESKIRLNLNRISIQGNITIKVEHFDIDKMICN